MSPRGRGLRGLGAAGAGPVGGYSDALATCHDGDAFGGRLAKPTFLRGGAAPLCLRVGLGLAGLDLDRRLEAAS